jgi:hypothetical protein
MTALEMYILSPDAPLSADLVDDLGLDSTGRDGDDRFPYTWANLTDAERRQLWQAYPPTVSVAETSTYHFDFRAVAATPAEARAALWRGWRAHVAQTDADPNYLTEDAINVMTGPLGQAWRDYSPIGEPA